MKSKKILFKGIVSCVALSTPILIGCLPTIITSTRHSSFNQNRLSMDAMANSSAESHFEYINERELSIGAFAVKDETYDLTDYVSYCFGTAWFYEYLGGNKYEMLTNYHVLSGIANTLYGSQQYGYHDAIAFLATDGFKDASKYTYKDYCIGDTDFDIADFKVIGANEGTREAIDPDTNKPYVDPETKKTISAPSYMDMVAITVDFTSALTNKYKSPTASYLESKISNLKKLYPEKGDKMFKVADTVTKGEDVYIAGYPWVDPHQDISKAKSRDWTQFTYAKTSTDDFFADRLNILSEGFFTYQSEWYVKAAKYFPLTAGSSGSAVLNDKDELCGIYWGGAQDANDVYTFKGSFATFECPGHAGTSFLDLVSKSLEKSL